MSLFPAYGQTSQPQDDVREEPKRSSDWLSNQSFSSSKHSVESLPTGRGLGESRDRRRKSRSSSRERSRKKKRKNRSRSRSPRRHRSRSAERSRHRQRRSRSRTPKRKKKSKQRSPTPPTKEELIAKFSTNALFLEEVGLKPKDAFREDFRADKTNVSAMSLPSSKTPNYKSRTIDVMGIFGRRKKSAASGDVARYYDKKIIKHLLRSEALILHPAKQTPDISDLKLHYVTIDNPKAKEQWKTFPDSNPLGIYDTKTVQYLDSGGKSTPRGEVESEGFDIKLKEIQMKTKRYNERLRANRTDVDLWLEYVDFQDEAMQESSFGNDDDEGLSKKKKEKKNNLVRAKAVIEKKLSILKSALEYNPLSVPLSVRRLEVSKEILETPTLDRQWKELVFLFPSNFDVWKHYLNYSTTYFTNFSVTSAIKGFKNCFSKMKQIQDQSFTTRDRPENVEERMTEVFVHLCTFLANGGFRERALCLFQAMVELNLFSPDLPGYYSIDDRLALLEQFWECGVPRFGEDNAKGWANVVKHRQPQDLPPLDSDEWEDELIEQTGRLLGKTRLWLELELGRERRHWRAWRSAEEESDDPDRSVIFDDISPFLFQFREGVQVFRFMVNFIHFLGFRSTDPKEFHPASLYSHTVARWFNIHGVETTPSEIDWTPDVICKLLQKTSADFVSDKNYQEILRNVFKSGTQALPAPFKTQMMIMWLQFEMAVFEKSDFVESRKAKAKELKKLVKSMLENDRNNIWIYIQYSLLEYNLEGYTQGARIVQVAMQAAGKHDPNLFRHAIALELTEHTKAKDDSEEPEYKHLQLAQWYLALAGQENSFESVPSDKSLILTACHNAKSKLVDKIHTQLRNPASEFAKCKVDFRVEPMTFRHPFSDLVFFAAWIHNFLDGFKESVGLIDFCLEKLVEESPLLQALREDLHKTKIDILVFQTGERASTGRFLREALRHALTEYPCNQYFLQKLCDIEVNGTSSSNLWRCFGNILTKSKLDSPLPHLYAIKLLVKKFVSYNETFANDESEAVSEIAIGSLYTARNILNDALKRFPLKHSVVLWRLLMWVTKTLHELQPHKFDVLSIKTVFYRSLQECPAAKPLYLDAIDYICKHKNLEELQITLDIMVEKEVRTRLPIEELDVLIEPIAK